MVAKGVTQFDIAYIADSFILLYKAQPEQFIAILNIVSSDSQMGMEATIGTEHSLASIEWCRP